MVNPRSKTKKTKKTKKTQNTSKPGFSQEDSDEQSSGLAALIGSNNDLLTQIQNTFMSQASIEDSDQQPTDSGAMIGSNDDLLTEILLRLPVISIFRFKSVSKHWRWLLCDRHFTLRYDNHNFLQSRGLFVGSIYVPFNVENRSPPPFRSLDFYPDPYGIRIEQSCNGLLLCCSNYFNSCDVEYYVFNPTTKQFAIVPSVGDYRVRKTICFMGLAFHPRNFINYKVVCIRKLHKKDLVEEFFQIQVYSSDTRKWNISVQSFSSDYPICFEKGVYWNGAIHWAPSQHDHLYFKLDVEQLHSLPLPVEMRSSDTFTKYFGESGGHLHLILSSDSHGYNTLHLSVYELLSDHLSGWFVKYQVDLDEHLHASPMTGYPAAYDFKVIDVVRGAKEEDTFMVLVALGKLITYNVHDKSFKPIFSLARGYLYGPSLSFHRYMETLASF